MIGRTLGSAVAYLVLLGSYAGTLAFARIGRLIPHRRREPSGCLVVTGTFFSSNWFASHAKPLAASGLDRVVFVADEPQDAPSGVVFLCPPRWFSACFGRAMAKSVWLFVAGWRYNPDLFMGFHLIPGAMGSLLAGRWFGRPTCYQMTGGPIEIIGGGYQSENSVTTKLARPSRLLERLAMSVACEHDLVVVRGSGAKAYMTKHLRRGTVEIITGSIPPVQGQPLDQRTYDMVFVARLTSIKQPEQFIDIVGRIAETMPSLRAVVIGDGPELASLKEQASRLGVDDNVTFLGHCDDVMGVLRQSKVFVLTSKSEGLSIALAEAMGAGLPGVVADVGDLADLVHDGENGYLVRPNDVDTYAKRVASILADPDLWSKLSVEASELARRNHSVDAVAARWRRCLAELCNGRSEQVAVDA